jgi:cytochrome c6
MTRICLALTILFTTLAAAADDDPGAVLYRRKMCHTCHGADGSGSTPTGKALQARDLRSEEVQKQTDAELADVITNGKGKMPAYKSSIDPEQIKELVSYIRRLK